MQPKPLVQSLLKQSIMTTSERLHRSYDYVNHSYARVLEALRRDASGILARATHAAAEREHAIGVQLHLRMAGIEVSTDVRVEVANVQERAATTSAHALATIPLTWSSVASPSLFPHLHGNLSLYPLSSHETQLELEGTYDPPLGLVGDAFDSVIGHRIADACVLRFVQDVAAQLRAELSSKS